MAKRAVLLSYLDTKTIIHAYDDLVLDWYNHFTGSPNERKKLFKAKMAVIHKLKQAVHDHERLRGTYFHVSVRYAKNIVGGLNITLAEKNLSEETRARLTRIQDKFKRRLDICMKEKARLMVKENPELFREIVQKSWDVDAEIRKMDHAREVDSAYQMEALEAEEDFQEEQEGHRSGNACQNQT